MEALLPLDRVAEILATDEPTAKAAMRRARALLNIGTRNRPAYRVTPQALDAYIAQLHREASTPKSITQAHRLTRKPGK